MTTKREELYNGITAKEKAEELYNRFYRVPLYVLNIKECCHVVVDEILKNGLFTFEDKKYWEEVKEEINKL